MKLQKNLKSNLIKKIILKKNSSCSSTCSSFYSLFFPFFPNQTQQPRTQTHHKNTKEKEKRKQIIISDSFIPEPELSHSFPTRITLSNSRPKQHDHSK